MRLSQYLFSTSKESSKEAEYSSHKLMLRAGLIKRFAAGIYSYLPLGYRVLAKISAVVEDEMNRIGAQRLLLPFLQPADLWKKSGRWENYGEELIRFQDRKNADFALGPTHEEMITQLVKEEIKSYKRLPLTLYQIQTKFRDELRPRGGVIRAREFLMKDAYSFCRNEEESISAYQLMKKAYERIFSRCGLDYRVVEAETGPIGGKVSEEFIALASSGEDKIVVCKHCGYAAKLEKAEYEPGGEPDTELKPMKEVFTPNLRTVKEVGQFLHCRPKDILKTIFYETDKGLIAALIRGDRQINEAKLKMLLKVERLEIAGNDLIKEEIGVEPGFTGPVGLDKYRLIADNIIMRSRNLVAGANCKDTHLLNVNAGRDFQPTIIGDIGYPLSGDACPRCKSQIEVRRGIEVGHLFQLGKIYSRSLKATFLNEKGEENYFVMGCYGIGVSRLPAAIIEQNHDLQGIIWPPEITPFQAIVIPTSEKTHKVAQVVYQDLKDHGIETLWDDRNLSAGVKFNDADLVGIPFKVIVGDSFLKEDRIEIKTRREAKIEKVKKNMISQRMKRLIAYAK
ncbi:MAG: proline--tRNA ligase [bacterium]